MLGLIRHAHVSGRDRALAMGRRSWKNVVINLPMKGRAIGIILLFSIIYSCSGVCACTIPAWGRMVGHNSSLVPVFRGVLGDKVVRGILRYDANKREFFGRFYGNDNSLVMNVYGYIDVSKPFSPMFLNVYGGSRGSILGRFYLKFPDEGFWINDKNEKVPYGDDCSSMYGTYVSSDRKVVEKVSLGIDGEVRYPQDGVALKNEEAAAKIRKSLLENDRRAVASLLDYPFHVYSADGNSSVLLSPDDVIKHFSRVAIFSRQGVSHSVPHYLQSYASTSTLDIDSGDIVIDNGKVRRICATRHPMYCPLIDEP